MQPESAESGNIQQLRNRHLLCHAQCVQQHGQAPEFGDQLPSLPWNDAAAVKTIMESGPVDMEES
jgi:hypothetical protein